MPARRSTPTGTCSSKWCAVASDVPKREHEARALIDARSWGGRCELHGGLGSNVHHRNKEGRQWVASNLLRLCGSGTTGCHGWIESHPEHAMALGLWVPREQDPAVVPMFCAPIQFALDWWLPDDAGMWHHTGWPGVPARDVALQHDAVDALRDYLATVGALS